MSTREENRNRRSHLNGEMSGKTEEIMQQLYNTLPSGPGVTYDEWKLCLNMMAELWMRGASKARFLREMNLPRRNRKDWLPTDLQQNRRSHLNGVMSGKTEQLVKQLYDTIPSGIGISLVEGRQWELCREMMAELWMRGASKARFIREMKLPRSQRV